MKKIVCLLLCLMMLIPAAVSMAAEEITSISVTLAIPKAGTKTDVTPSITLSNSRCHVDFFIYLKKGSDGNYASFESPEVFEAGKEYYAFIGILAQSGDTFPGGIDSVTSNCSIVKGESYTDQNVLGLFVKFTVPSNEKVTLSKLKSVKLTALSAKKLKVTWKKLSSKDQKKIQKIQIQYSTDKTFKTGVKTKWAKKGKTSYTISGLKKNTKYYVRIRAYKKSGNIIYVSKWVTKNKKTKK